jgi:hypothetical protein
MIVTESRSLAGVLRGTAADYLCPIAATNGQTQGFLHTTLAPALCLDQHVLYLGDLDHAGGLIEAHTRRVLEHVVGPLRWERLAITEEQTAAHALPSVTKHDRRYRGDKQMAVQVNRRRPANHRRPLA